MTLKSALRWTAIISFWLTFATGSVALFAQPTNTLPAGTSRTLAGPCRVVAVDPAPPARPAVWLRRLNAAQAEPAQRSAELRPGDALQTTAGGSALLALGGEGYLRISEGSQIRVVAQSGLSWIWLQFQAGKALYSGFRPRDTIVQSPAGTAASRHTEFTLRVLGSNETEVTVLNGLVLFTNAGVGLTLGLGQTNQARARTGSQPVPVRVSSLVQWWLYYPNILDVGELELGESARAALKASLEVYATGNFQMAMQLYPADYEPTSDSERVYAAALRLVIGDLAGADTLLATASPGFELVRAYRLLIDTVRQRALEPASNPSSATGWLALSFFRQSRFQLAEALAAARQSVQLSPNFGTGWVRVGELELGREAYRPSVRALDIGLQLSPFHAQGHAIKGFLCLAENHVNEAEREFATALDLDSFLSNAWLGKGLCDLRRHRRPQAIDDLEIAVALEPERALLRDYLAKLFATDGRWTDAAFQLQRARQIDPNDPTSWFYSALLARETNSLNAAVTNLAESIRLNGNRQLFRSREQLDQDEAVRRANVAGLYRDVGMVDWSLWEAGRAVGVDPLSPDAHLFLAHSYAFLQDRFQTSLRYETAAESEYLLANLLAPVEAAQLASAEAAQFSPAVVFDRPTEFFVDRNLELASSTEVRQPGGWIQTVLQQGRFPQTAYALDYVYLSIDRGWPNTDLTQEFMTATVKQQLTLEDSFYLSAQRSRTRGGDIQFRFDPNQVDPTFRFSEDQLPNVTAGWRHHWAPGQETLVLFGSFSDEFAYRQGAAQVPVNELYFGSFLTLTNKPLQTIYRKDLNLRSIDVQQAITHPGGILQAGLRFQQADDRTRSRLDQPRNADNSFFANPASLQDLKSSIQRFSPYLYENAQLRPDLRLTLGLTYDDVRFPQNVFAPPLSAEGSRTTAWSPKVGLLWMPQPETALRAVYTRSLGGFSFDTSVRLEPSQIFGFNQAFRTLIPESVTGNVPGTDFEMYGIALSRSFADTWFGVVSLERASSHGDLILGGFTVDLGTAQTPSETTFRERLRYDETTASVSLNYLAGQDWAFAARFGVSEADLSSQAPLNLPLALRPGGDDRLRVRTYDLGLSAIWQLPVGVFVRGAAEWLSTENHAGHLSLPDDSFLELDLVAGYRLPRRRAVFSVGVLDLTGTDYRLHPLAGRADIPRQRTFVASLSFSF